MSEKRIGRQPPRVAAEQAAETGAGAAAGPAPVTKPSPEERQRMIAEAAYFRAERRGFAAGGELDDWLRAEAEIDRMIEQGGTRSKHALQHL
jgi:hypothetical protein